MKQRFAKDLLINLVFIINTSSNLQVSHLPMLLTTRQFLLSVIYASQSPQHEQSYKGKCKLLLIPILFPIAEQMPQDNVRE